MLPDIGTSELIILAVVILLVVKPKDLPMMMRRIGEFMGKARRLASDFRASFDDMARQSELEELRKEVEAMRATATDPTGLSAALKDTQSEIHSSLTTDPDFDYGAQTEDVPWEDPVMTAEPAPEPAPKTVAKKSSSSKPAAAKPKTARSSAAKPKTSKPIVEGGPKPSKPRAVAAKGSRKRAT